MDEHRDIYQKPDSEAKKEEELPRHEWTPADFRARSMRNTVVFSAVMLLLLGIATWIISLQEKKGDIALPEPPPSTSQMLTMSAPVIMSNLTTTQLSAPVTIAPPSAEEAAQIDLKILPYDSGFFITIPCGKADEVSKFLIEENIFVASLSKGVRVAGCSVPAWQMNGLAKRIQNAIAAVKG